MPRFNAERRPVNRYLDAVGDGSGTKIANGDYSGEVTRFRITPKPGECILIARLIILVADTRTNRSDQYGAIDGGLTNGIAVKVRRGGVELDDLTNGLPIKTNGEWARLCHDAEPKPWSGAGPDSMSVRWTFLKGGAPIELDGGEGDELCIELNDDLRGLTDHTFFAHGCYAEGPE